MGVEDSQDIEHALESKEPNKLLDKIHNLYIASQKCINPITAQTFAKIGMKPNYKSQGNKEYFELTLHVLF